MTNQLSILLNTRYDLTRGGSFVRPLVLRTGEVAQWIVCIPDWWPANINSTYGRSHHVGSKDKAKAARLLATYGHPTPKFTGHVRLRLIRLWAKRCRAFDTDNLYSSTKVLIDPLKSPKGRQKNRRLSVIADDCADDLDLVVEQHRSETGRAYCVVVIEGKLARGGAA